MTPDWLMAVLFRLDLTSRDDNGHNENTKWSTALGTRLHLYNHGVFVFCVYKQKESETERKIFQFKVKYCLGCYIHM